MYEDFTLNMLTFFLIIGWNVQFVICWKMVKGPKTFINTIFMASAMIRAVLLPIQFNLIVEIGEYHFGQRFSPAENLIQNCGNFFVLFKILLIVDCLFNMGSLFCRFVYLVHAYELIINKVKIFHFLVCCLIGTFTLQFLLVGPLGFLAFKAEVFPFNTLEGALCASGEVRLSEGFQPFLREHLIILTFLVLLSLCNLHFMKTSMKIGRMRQIPRRKVNFITMKAHLSYSTLVLISAFLKRCLDGVLHLFSNNFEQETVFRVWWGSQILYILLIDVFAQTFILRSILQKDEYNGFVGRSYPGKPKPHNFIVVPRRDNDESIIQIQNNGPEGLPISSSATGTGDERRRGNRHGPMVHLTKENIDSKEGSYSKLRKKVKTKRLETIVELPPVEI